MVMQHLQTSLAEAWALHLLEEMEVRADLMGMKTWYGRETSGPKGTRERRTPGVSGPRLWTGSLPRRIFTRPCRRAGWRERLEPTQFVTESFLLSFLQLGSQRQGGAMFKEA